MVELEMQLDGIRLDTIDSARPPTPSSTRSPQVAPMPNTTSSISQSSDSKQLLERLKALESDLKKEKNETRVEFEAKIEALTQLKNKERSEVDLQQKLQEALQKITGLEEQSEKQQQKITDMQKSYQREINTLKSQNNAIDDEKQSSAYLKNEFDSLSEKFETTNVTTVIYPDTLFY
jgi:chromosome segregation ATPase